MQADKITEYSLLIPKIKTRIKLLKNRRNKRIQRINQVTDSAMTLISGTEVAENPCIKRENVIKIQTYFESVVLPQAKLDVVGNKSNCKAVYLICKNQIVGQLNKIEDAVTKLNAKNIGEAATFFNEFGNNALNDDAKFLGEIEKLIVLLASKKSNPSSNDTFKKIRNYLNTETQKLVGNLKNICTTISKESLQMTSNLFPNSTIVKPEETELVNEWIKDQLGASKMFDPLFNTEDHGFTAQAFHSICDNKGATIIFIEATNGKRFGGYANSSWHSYGKFIKDEKCFIFSLDLKEKYLHFPGNSCSIGGCLSYGPYFGAPDLILFDNCNSNGNSYCIPNGAYDCRSRTSNDIAGSEYFTVKNYEVYQMRQITNEILFVRQNEFLTQF